MDYTLSNGRTIALDKDARFTNPRAEGLRWLEQYNAPAIEIIPATGIVATFRDGAKVTLTVNGLFPCSLCNAMQCKHLHQALPYWTRYKWETAERADCPWGPTLLRGIGIVPYVVDPALVYKQSRHAPFSKGEEVAPGVRMWHTAHGRLYHFWDDGNGLSATVRVPDGHVYVGDDHPDGHTDCLVCRDGCGHVARALDLAWGDAKAA